MRIIPKLEDQTTYCTMRGSHWHSSSKAFLPKSGLTLDHFLKLQIPYYESIRGFVKKKTGLFIAHFLCFGGLTQEIYAMLVRVKTNNFVLPKKMAREKIVNFRLGDEINSLIQNGAQRENVSKTQIVRNAVKSYFQSNTQSEKK